MSPPKVSAKDGGALEKLSSVGEESALEEGLPPPQENSFNNDGDGAEPAKGGARLSVVSQQYDKEGKGYLDDAQAKMRALDTSNRGYLTNDRVYDMMKQQLEMQKQMVTQKRLIVGLLVFTVILALANMGTAFAAATFAKDTTVNAGSAVVSTADGGVVGMGAVVDTIKVEQEGDRRELAGNPCNNGDPNESDTCVENLKSFRVTGGKAQAIYDECGAGNPGISASTTVKLQATCNPCGQETTETVTLCTADSNEALSSGIYTYTLPAATRSGLAEIKIDCSGQGQGQCSVKNFCPCMSDSDCGPGYKCCGCACIDEKLEIACIQGCPSDLCAATM